MPSDFALLRKGIESRQKTVLKLLLEKAVVDRLWNHWRSLGLRIGGLLAKRGGRTPDDSVLNRRLLTVSEINRAAKLLAKELNIPVFLPAQLSRKVEEQADKMPLLSDLRESETISRMPIW